MIYPILVTIFTRATFFSIQYWLFPILLIMSMAGIFAVMAASIHCNSDDITIATLIGVNLGVVMGIIAQVTPGLMIIPSVLLLLMYLVVNGSK